MVFVLSRSRGPKPNVHVWAGVSPEASLLGLLTAPSHCVLMGSSLCVCAPPSVQIPCCRDTGPVASGPTLTASFYLNHLSEGPVFKCSHIRRYWGLEFQLTNLGGHNSAHSVHICRLLLKQCGANHLKVTPSILFSLTPAGCGNRAPLGRIGAREEGEQHQAGWVLPPSPHWPRPVSGQDCRMLFKKTCNLFISITRYSFSLNFF